MNSEFDPFTRLPREIQAAIWDAAVRPAPGKHVQKFIITDHHFDYAQPPFPISGSPLQFTRRGRPQGGYSLAVPWDDPHARFNDSVYTLDNGLWMACTQSRAAMERRFNRNEWWLELESPGNSERLSAPGKYSGLDGVTHSASYVGRDGERNYITFRSEQDLLCLDPRYLDSVDWSNHVGGDDVPLINYRDGRHKDVPILSFLGQNIGLDYDPGMMDTLEERPTQYRRDDLRMSSTSLVTMVNLLYRIAGRTLWFIDHRLRPISPTDKEPSTTAQGRRAILAEAGGRSLSKDYKGREIFSSKNSTLIEVKREDLGTCWVIDTENDEPDVGERSVFDFINPLFQAAAVDCNNPSRLRLLACQDTFLTCLTCFPKETVRCVERIEPVVNDRSDVGIEPDG
ncbi:hypothetical protein AK830_g9036 [Neonectria ditissima]|uniref:Uncharacterized protein n=1 Tax=Neonectria ditissima TaxID=78410 RepID=A0A0P7BD15_9HYPO|nr:hypothetical protein AK830_g9036 [Neonectria ditissima]